MSLVPAPAPAPVEEDVLLTPLYDALVGEYADAGAGLDTGTTGTASGTGASASDAGTGIPVEGVSAEVLGLDTGAVLYEGPLSEEHEAWLMSRMSALRVDPRNPLHGGTTGKEDLV